MAGYSGTPLPKKLGIKPNHAVALINAPDGFEETFEEMPSDVEILNDLKSRKAF
jgi:hypothetical protein